MMKANTSKKHVFQKTGISKILIISAYGNSLQQFVCICVLLGISKEKKLHQYFNSS